MLYTRDVDLFGVVRHVVGSGDAYHKGLSSSGFREFQSVCEHLPASWVMLDVGANIGATTLIAAPHLSAGTIYAIEASPIVFEALQQTLACNEISNALAYNFAASASDGAVAFHQNSAFGHIEAGAPADGIGLVEVPMKRLDTFVAEEQIQRVDFIKIDVEGFEQHVLDGLAETEARHRPLYFMEFNSWTLTAYGRINPLDFLERLIDAFQVVLSFDESGARIPLTKADAVLFLYKNMTSKNFVEDLLFTNDPTRLAHGPVRGDLKSSWVKRWRRALAQRRLSGMTPLTFDRLGA